ncbi:MAG TPA: hypothetical protein V6C57_11980 [Coleofasciculaceae cyanobacterium]
MRLGRSHDKASIKASVKVSVWVEEGQSSRRGGKVLLWLAGIGAVGLLSWGGWLAANLIINPAAVAWLNDFLPEWGRFAVSQSAQTMAEIEAEVAKAGRGVGQPVSLSAYVPKTSAIAQDILLPIFAPQSYCHSKAEDCRQMVELRAYRPSALRSGSTPRFDLIDRLKVAGPEEGLAIAPLTHSQVVNPGSNRQLPLTMVTVIEGKAPDAAVWLHLSGQWQRSTLELVYGQVVRYDPLRDRLQLLLSWTSPAGQLPRWQQVTGAASPELVVDQTVGLEPQFQVYQVQPAPGHRVKLEAIGLNPAGPDQPAYRQGLLLARNGLWSAALDLLQKAKQAGGSWSAMAQAQLDLVALHARVTQAQSSRDWASPTQQITALLIDNRWAKALQLLQLAHTNGYDVKTLLAANGNLRQRVEAYLQVHPHQLEAQQWGALSVAVQRDRAAALTWLQRRSGAGGRSSPLAAILALLASPDAPAPPPFTNASAPAAAAVLPRLIGSVTPLSHLRPSDWFSPVPLQLPAQQSWYEIQVLGVQEDQTWRRSSIERVAANLTGAALWHRLGLDQNPSLQIMVWSEASPQSIPAHIWAVQRQAGNLYLLASADPMPQFTSQPAIALTPNTLQWLAPLEVLTLSSLHQQQPQPTATLIASLEHELQQAGQMPKAIAAAETGAPKANAAEAGAAAEPLSQVGDWRVDRMELTGDAPAELVMTLTTEGSDSASHPLTHTLIFSSTGAVLYSDLSIPDQAIVAIADLQNGELPALIIRKGQSYEMRQWSQQQHQFE